MTEPSIEWHHAFITELNPVDLYRLLKLRIDVFVVEQQCAYPELDMRDLEPQTVHCWATDGEAVVSYLRILEDPKGVARIGRVCTAYQARSHGVARELLNRALRQVGERTVEISAQSHLAPWYETFGFEISGSPFFEVGMPHIPMRLLKTQN